jgi:uncharacterized phage infection (PIP) family protein YhgE
MDERQQRQVNEAAEKFAQSLTEAYRAVVGRSVSAQEINAKLTQDFFNGVINNLRTQAQNNRALAEGLLEQQRKQREASQALTQESVNAYMEFLNSVFAFAQQGTQSAGQAAREAAAELSAEPDREEDATEADAVRHPLSSWVQNSPEVISAPGSEEQASREAPPPGEERPERRGAVPTSQPTRREEPPAGEERPGRRTP